MREPGSRQGAVAIHVISKHVKRFNYVKTSLNPALFTNSRLENYSKVKDAQKHSS